VRRHYLKTWPVPFEAIWRGDKSAELRRDDRDFRTGDTLVLREYRPESDDYTGRWKCAVVTHIIRPDDGFPGLESGYAVLSIDTNGMASSDEYGVNFPWAVPEKPKP
jgi:hypothetical protein